MRVYISGNNVSDWVNGDNDSLDKFLIDNGHTVDISISSHTDSVLFLNWSTRCLRDLRQSERLGIPRVLIITEPSVVIPAYRNRRLMSRFSAKLEFGRPKLGVPYPQQFNLQYFDFEDRLDEVVAVAGKKESYVSGELYSLRTDAFSQIDGLSLFGTGWDARGLQSIVSNLKQFLIAIVSRQRISLRPLSHVFVPSSLRVDQVPNKLEAMSRYKYALVIENSEEYVSEKLLDAMMAGCVPVYVGGDPGAFGIPDELYVKSEPSVEKILQGIVQARNIEYSRWKFSAIEFLNSQFVSEARSGEKANWRIMTALIVATASAPSPKDS